MAPVASIAPESASVGMVHSYLFRPIGLQVASPDPDGTTVYPVEHAFNATLVMGLGVTDRLQVHASTPFTLVQVGASKSDITGSDEELPRSAAGDVRFGVLLSLLKRDPPLRYPPQAPCGPGLSLRLDVAAPTGSKDAFVSYRAVTWAPGVSFDYRVDRLHFGSDVGLRLRKSRRLAGTIIGNQASLSLGAGYDILADGWLSVQAEAFALFSFDEQLELVSQPGQFQAREEPSGVPHIPAEWLFSVQTAGMLDGKLRASLGGGGTIPTSDRSAVTAPAMRGVASLRYVFGD